MGGRSRALRAEGRKAASLLAVLAVLAVFGLSVWRDLATTVAFDANQSRAASVARIPLLAPGAGRSAWRGERMASAPWPAGVVR